MAAPRHVALRFLSGRLRGAVLPVERGSSLVLGRGPGADLVVADDAVSRRHARVCAEGDALVVEDLGSVNGTYVNGARVPRARAGEGDRLLVGRSLARIVVGDVLAAPPELADAARPRPGAAAAPSLRGNVADVPLADLLQLCSSTRRSGTLHVEHAGQRVTVTLHDGRIAAAAIAGRPELPPEKCLYRLLAWTAGRFELRYGEPPASSVRFAASTQGSLMEAMRQLDELRRLRPTLPARVAPAPQAAQGPLSPEERALVALAAGGGERDEGALLRRERALRGLRRRRDAGGERGA